MSTAINSRLEFHDELTDLKHSLALTILEASSQTEPASKFTCAGVVGCYAVKGSVRMAGVDSSYVEQGGIDEAIFAKKEERAQVVSAIERNDLDFSLEAIYMYRYGVKLRRDGLPMMVRVEMPVDVTRSRLSSVGPKYHLASRSNVNRENFFARGDTNMWLEHIEVVEDAIKKAEPSWLRRIISSD